MTIPSYLHTLRKRSGLSQPELASLFDLTASALSRFENLSRRPSVDLLIGAEVIFGGTAREVFPALYLEIERDIVERARALHGRFAAMKDRAARAKERFLAEIIERLSQATLGL